MVEGILLFGSTHMKIQLKPSKKDIEKIEEKYERNLDWKLLSHCLTTTYDWIFANRSRAKHSITVKIKYDETLAGWYYYGETIYVNLENNETFEEFIQTIFHEFRHWVQFKIDKRPAASMISKRKKGWDMEQAELEAESWEKIGEKIFEMYKLLDYIKTIHK